MFAMQPNCMLHRDKMGRYFAWTPAWDGTRAMTGAILPGGDRAQRLSIMSV